VLVTLTFALAGMLTLASPVLLRLRYSRSWSVRPFFFFLISAVVYQFLSQCIIRIMHLEAPQLPSVKWADRGLAVAASALFVMTVVYVMVGGPDQRPTIPERDAVARVIDWRVLGALCLPLLAVTVQGRGYITGRPLDASSASITGLSAQFLIPLVALSALGYLLRHPTRWALTLMSATAVLALAGQRLEVIVVGIVVTALGVRVGIRPTLRQMALVLLGALLLLVGITSVRSMNGRDEFYGNTGVVTRVQAIANGAINPQYVGVSTNNPIGDAALRLDSTSWSGQVALAMKHSKPVGVEVLVDSVLTMVPRVIFGNKLQALDVEQRSAELNITRTMGMPMVDYLPGHATSFYGALSFPGLLVLCAGFGMLMARLDAWSLRSAGPVALLAYETLMQCALFYERGMTFYLFAMRAGLLIGAVIWLWNLALGPRSVERTCAVALSRAEESV